MYIAKLTITDNKRSDVKLELSELNI